MCAAPKGMLPGDPDEETDEARVNDDTVNVMGHLDVDPIPDLRTCAEETRSFCVKDHRNRPKDEDSGIGFGEVDQYRLLSPAAFTRREMPRCCGERSAPVISGLGLTVRPSYSSYRRTRSAQRTECDTARLPCDACR